MTKTKTIVIGNLLLTLLAFGLVALAGGGFGKGVPSDKPGAGACMQERDSDGDGIPNCDDPDWTRPLDGTGYGATNCLHAGAENGHENGLHDRDGRGQGSCQRNGNGGGRGMHRGYGNGARMGVNSE
jgi:hypothetical protein